MLTVIEQNTKTKNKNSKWNATRNISFLKANELWMCECNMSCNAMHGRVFFFCSLIASDQKVVEEKEDEEEETNKRNKRRSKCRTKLSGVHISSYITASLHLKISEKSAFRSHILCAHTHTHTHRHLRLGIRLCFACVCVVYWWTMTVTIVTIVYSK